MRTATGKEIEFINAHRAMGELQPDDVYVQAFLLANTAYIDKYSMFLHSKAVKQMADKAGMQDDDGVNFKVMHDRYKVIALGKSFAGAFDNEAKVAYAKFYFPKGHSENGYTTEDLVRGIDTGVYTDTSFGMGWPLNEKSMKCSLCGGNPLWFRKYLGGKGEFCGHWPGDMYKVTEAMSDFIKKMKTEGMDSYPDMDVKVDSEIECRMWCLDTEGNLDELSVVDRGASDSRPARENEIPVKFSVAKEHPAFRLAAKKEGDEGVRELLGKDLRLNIEGHIETTDFEESIEVFTHNSKTADSEPSWGSVDKGKLPRIAFARKGDANSKSSWGFPHHFISGGSKTDDNGCYTDGTLYLHKGGLNAAYSASQGGRSGKKAEQAVIDHLQTHRKALGLNTSDDIELLGEQDPNVKGGEVKLAIKTFSERIKLAMKVLTEESVEGTEDASLMLAEVQKELARLEGVEKENNIKIASLETAKLEAEKKYSAIPEDIRTKIEDTTLTWDIVVDYVKTCQKEIDSICTDLCNAAVAAKGNEAKVEDLKAEIVTKVRAFGLEAAIDHGRKMIKTYQGTQTLKPGQKADNTATDTDEHDEAKKDEALVAMAKESVKKFNKN